MVRKFTEKVLTKEDVKRLTDEQILEWINDATSPENKGKKLSGNHPAFCKEYGCGEKLYYGVLTKELQDRGYINGWHKPAGAANKSGNNRKTNESYEYVIPDRKSNDFVKIGLQIREEQANKVKKFYGEYRSVVPQKVVADAIIKCAVDKLEEIFPQTAFERKLPCNAGCQSSVIF